LRVPFPPLEYRTPEELETTLRAARLVPRGTLLVLSDAARGLVRQASSEVRRQRAAALASTFGDNAEDAMQSAMAQMLQQMAQLPGGSEADNGAAAAGGPATLGDVGGLGGLGGALTGEGNYEELLRLEDALGGAVAHGLSVGEMLSLAVRPIDDATLAASDLGSCCICCCEFVAGDRLMSLHCKHAFHPECISTWLRAKRTCPICKRSAVGESEDEQPTEGGE